MKRVELRTADNHFVAVVEVPPFVPGEPKVVGWGARVFVASALVDVYTEVLACVSLTPSPGLPRADGAPLPASVPPITHVDSLRCQLAASQGSNRRLRDCLQHAEQTMARRVYRLAMEYGMDHGEFTFVTTSGSKDEERRIAKMVVDELELRQSKVTGPLKDISNDGTLAVTEEEEAP